jgi:hypothetical protein
MDFHKGLIEKQGYGKEFRNFNSTCIVGVDNQIKVRPLIWRIFQPITVTFIITFQPVTVTNNLISLITFVAI